MNKHSYACVAINDIHVHELLTSCMSKATVDLDLAFVAQARKLIEDPCISLSSIS